MFSQLISRVTKSETKCLRNRFPFRSAARICNLGTYAIYSVIYNK
jgi:hypothetical protein